MRPPPRPPDPDRLDRLLQRSRDLRRRSAELARESDAAVRYARMAIARSGTLVSAEPTEDADPATRFDGPPWDTPPPTLPEKAAG